MSQYQMRPGYKPIIYTDRTDRSLDLYLKDIAKFPLLTPEELRDLLQKIKAGDKEAEQKVINCNLRFCVTIAKRFQHRGVELMDLISQANMGLIEGVRRFNPDKKVPFLTYCVLWIKQAIYLSIYWAGRQVRLPVSQHLMMLKVTNAVRELTQENYSTPSIGEIAERSGLNEEQVSICLTNGGKISHITDSTLTDDDDLTIEDLLSTPDPSPEDYVDKVLIQYQLQLMIDALSPMEHDLIMMLYGIGMPKVDIAVVAPMFGLGTERIRQLKDKTVKRINKKFKNELAELL